MSSQDCANRSEARFENRVSGGCGEEIRLVARGPYVGRAAKRIVYEGPNNAPPNLCPKMASVPGSMVYGRGQFRARCASSALGNINLRYSGQSASGPGESSAPPDPALPNLGLVMPHLVVNGALFSTLSCPPAFGSLGFAVAGAGEWRAFDFESFINPPWNGRRNGRHVQVRRATVPRVSAKGTSAAVPAMAAPDGSRPSAPRGLSRLRRRRRQCVHRAGMERVVGGAALSHGNRRTA